MKDIKLSQDFSGLVEVSIKLTNKLDVKALQELVGIELLDVTIKKHRNKRTLTQNAALWIICDKMATVLQTDKEAVYKMAIEHVGVFELIPIKNEAVDMFKTSWSTHGEGWICKEFRESKLDGYTTLQCFYGSSVYNVKQQARLIDYIIESAKDMGLDVMSKEEVERLKR